MSYKMHVFFGEHNACHVLDQYNALMFCFTILVHNQLGKLGTRLGRLGIAWDDSSFIDLESFY